MSASAISKIKNLFQQQKESLQDNRFLNSGYIVHVHGQNSKNLYQTERTGH